MSSLLAVTVFVAASLGAVLVALPANVTAATLFVGGIGPGNFTTIQAAVGAANPGDTVYVYDGIYRENVVISKTISLIGQNRDSTVIDARRIQRGIAVSAQGVRVSRFTITNGNPGIEINSADDCLVSSNIISNGYAGITVTNSFRTIVVDNIISSNSGDGIRLTTSGISAIENNVISSNGNYGIYLSSSVGNTIRDNIASSNNRGINLESSSNNYIVRNGAYSNDETHNPYRDSGIYLTSSTGNTLDQNNASSNDDYGIFLEYSASNVITGNTVSSNSQGIYLISSSQILMTGNYVMLNYNGIALLSSTTNTLTQNSISSNAGRGLSLDSSADNTITDNSVSSNDGTGLDLRASSDNIIFHNNIVGNYQQAYDDSANEWDDGYPSGGNYWSDYGGTDQFSGPLQNQAGSDGIGDVLRYIPDGTSVDHYPKVNPNAVPQSPPSQPRNLRATPGNAQVTLTWETPTSDGGSPVLNYRIYRRIQSSQEEFLLQVGNVLTYTDTGLKNGVKHSYRVSARNLVGEGLKATEAYATPATVPGPPVGLAAMAESRLVTLTWMLPTDNGGSSVTNFRIYRGVSPDGESLLAEVGNVTQYVDLGLTNGVTYFYKVTAINAVGEGSYSEEVSAIPSAIVTTPGPPTRLAAAAGDGVVVLTWGAPADNGGAPITNYSVYRGPFSGGEAFLVEVENVLSYTDTGLANGQTYFYRVAAKNSIGEGTKSDSVSATPMTTPGEPVGLMATPGNNRVTLSWLPPVDDGGSAVTYYSLYRGTTSGGEIYLLTPGNVLAYTDTGLTNGVTYYYQVTASNSISEGSKSSEVSVTPSSPPPNQAPSCSITSPPADSTISGRYPVIGIASDPEGTVEFVEVRMDGSGWMRAVGTTAWSFDLDTAIYSDSGHTIYVRSFDGTEYSTLVTLSVTIRNNVVNPPPQIPLSEQGWFWAAIIAIIAASLCLLIYANRKMRAARQAEQKRESLSIKKVKEGRPQKRESVERPGAPLGAGEPRTPEKKITDTQLDETQVRRDKS